MKGDRIFLGWDKPALISAAELLIGKIAHTDFLDLTHITLVLPSARAGRRLLEILTILASDKNCAILPPSILTPGALPELLYQPQRRILSENQSLLFWAECLSEAFRTGEIETSLAMNSEGRVSSSDEKIRSHTLTEIMPLASGLYDIRSEIYASCLSFTDVADKLVSLSLLEESERWQTLEMLDGRFLDLLLEHEVTDKHSGRKEALRAMGNRQTELQELGEPSDTQISADEQGCEVYLLGISELSLIARRLLETSDKKVSSLVFAPEDLGACFDHFGLIIEESWSENRLPLTQVRTWLCSSPLDECLAIARRVSEIKASAQLSDITIGLCEESRGKMLQDRLEKSVRTPTHLAAQESIAESEVVLALKSLGRFLETRSYSDLAELVRSPLSHLLGLYEKQGEFNGLALVEELDSLFEERLPLSLKDCPYLRSYPLVESFLSHLDHLLGQSAHAKRPLTFWAEKILEWLNSLWGHITCDSNSREEEDAVISCLAIRDALWESTQIPLTITSAMSAPEAIEYLAQLLAQKQTSQDSVQNTIEIIGWLELALDDAPTLFISGFNEGYVPSSITSDPFLPDSLRRSLGLTHNGTRTARDSYALSTMLHSKAHLEIFLTKWNSQAEPLMPSRLLFRVQEESLPEQALTLFGPAQNLSSGIENKNPQLELNPAPLFNLPEPDLRDPISRVRVTSLKDYLRCPYEFFLLHVLKLSAPDDSLAELGPMQYGIVVHKLLCDFGQSRFRDSTDESEINSFFEQQLSWTAKTYFGPHPLPSVKIQVEQLRERLRGFAKWQSEHSRQGWKIHEVEFALDPSSHRICVEGGEIGLSGRIDRIDHNPRTGEWLVIDYKTADVAKDPSRDHRTSKGQWLNLQLPAYRYLLLRDGYPNHIQLGYLPLSQESSRIEPNILAWDDEVWKESECVLLETLSKIRSGIFWPPAQPHNSSRASQGVAKCLIL